MKSHKKWAALVEGGAGPGAALAVVYPFMPIPLAQQNCLNWKTGNVFFHAAPHPAPATNTVSGTAPLRGDFERPGGAFLCFFNVDTTDFSLSFGEEARG